MSIIPSAITRSDTHIVCRVSDGKPIEGHPSLGRANRAAHVLNFHNEQHGHATRFEVKLRADVPELNQRK